MAELPPSPMLGQQGQSSQQPGTVPVATGHSSAGPIVPPSIAQDAPQTPNFIPEPTPDPFYKSCCRYIYNKNERTFFGRTCRNWMEIIVYSILYLIFLATYTMILLYISLAIIKNQQGSSAALSDFFFLTYSDDVGLTATPAGVGNDIFPLIWYRNGEADEYEKYVNALDSLLEKHSKGQTETLLNELGPCGKHPYGYGDRPCIVLRINKQINWAARPLRSNSTFMQSAPEQVKKWVRMDPKKYWLLCNGYHSYDKEHIGNIKYYPFPPGFDSELFPVEMNATSQLVAIQVSNFTLGMSLSIECKLWYEKGFSSMEFMIYVAPRRFHRNNSVIIY